MSSETFVDVSFKGKWTVTPAIRIEDKNIVVRGKWLKVASIHDELWLDSSLQDPEVCVRELKSLRSSHVAIPDILTFAQKLPAVSPMWKYPIEWESVAAVRLSNFTTWWESLPQETRKNARRATKRGVVVDVRPLDDDLIRDIVELNNDSPMRQGAPFHHYGKSFDQVKKDQSTHLERSDFICAYVGKELIGFLKMVYCGAFGSLLLLITKPSHNDKRTANALMVKAIERCLERGMSFMVYGKYRYGNQPPTSLMKFKDHHGFSEIMVPRFYVPLTLKGEIGMAMKLHRDRVALLPESVISVGRRVRAEWYKLKQSPRPV
jgi:hypothetical protein